MEADSTNAFSAAKGPLPNPRTRSARSVLLRRFYALGTLILLMECSAVVWGADSYSSALDRRFSSAPASEPANPEVVALEQGLKEQVHEMSQRPEVSPPPTEPASGLKLCLLGAGCVVGAFVVGVITVMALRRWNRWLDRPVAKLGSAEGIMAEDPALVEFLRSLREGVDIPPPPVGPPGSAPPEELLASNVASQDSPTPDPLAEAFALMCKYLAEARAALSEIGRVSNDAQRLLTLREISDLVDLIKEASALPHLRSIWLLTSALQGLLKQLSSKAADITPSALRTVAMAIDSLELLCSRTVRPDLATNPPVRLLAVDDDPISRRAVSVALKKAFSGTELACDGHNALAMAQQRAYDLIFLDVEMPGLDGFETCSKIHEIELNRATPVVFVTCHTDFDARAKSARVGAHDLIGKPFLAFEITVKALAMILKARLGDRGAMPAFSEMEDGSSFVAPRQSVDGPVANAVRAALTPSDGPAPNAGQASTKPQVVAAHAIPAGDPSSAIGKPLHLAPPGLQSKPPAAAQPSRGEFARAFFKGAPAHVQSLLNKLASIRPLTSDVDRDELLGEIFIGVHTICSEAGRAQLDAAFRVSSALEAMLKKLVERPAAFTPSAPLTATAALETIELLCQREEDLDLSQTPARLLVVDDDPVARRAIGGALQLAFGRPDSADCGEAAIILANEKAYDLILLDVIMPGMDGFAACTRLHESDLNRRTPVVFVTSQDDTNSRNQAAVSGGCGFIPKPVLPCEIMVLALTHIVRARLEHRSCEPWESADRLPACATALAG
jgi:CheY-like chemotaxis protein